MRHRTILITLMFLLLSVTAGAKEKQQQKRTVEVAVTNIDGRGIEGAFVYGENILSCTDYRGECVIRVSGKGGLIRVEADGYSPKSIDVGKNKSVTVSLSEAGDFGPDASKVSLWYKEMDKESVLSSVSSVDVENRASVDRYGIGDTESYIFGLLPGLREGSNIRGIAKALYVIDGVPGRDITQVSPDEIESVTVLRDANALALYGSQGANGVVLVNTKRGKIQKNEVTISADYGLDFHKALPSYLSSSEYMTLYNEACINDGLAPKYSQESIEQYASGMNPYKYPDFDFFSKDYIKSARNRADVTAEFRGGEDNLRYYVNLKYSHYGTFEKINPEIDKGANRYQVRANLDFRINKFITSSVDVMLSIGSDKNAHNSLFSSANSLRPNLYAPLIPLECLSDELRGSSFMQTVKVYDGYILGGNSSYKDIVPIADIFGGGYVNRIDRNTQISNTVNFDLSFITKGLYAKTFIGFDYYDLYNLSVTNQYNFYEPTWDGEQIVALTALGQDDLKGQVEKVGVRGFTMRLGGNVQIGYDRTFGRNNVSAMFLAHTFMTKPRNVIQEEVNSHLAFDISYNWDRRYFIDLTGAYLNSTKLTPGHRGGFSPAISIGYVLSNEPFMENVDFLDYLKVRASYANLKSDASISEYYLYQDFYQVKGSGSFAWDDGTYTLPATGMVNGSNYNLTYINKNDISAGLEAELFKSLNFEAVYFRSEQDGFVKRSGVTYPSFYQDFAPYYNNGTMKYEGTEIAVSYKKRYGDFRFDIGANFTYTDARITAIDEVTPEYDYLSDIGKPVGSISGLRADGLYQTSDFDGENLKAGLPVPTFGNVQPGDIKYIDKNKDGVIDVKDKESIGTTIAPFSLGVNFTLRYKALSLFVLGRGMFGGNAMLNHKTYYWADGEDKYSNVVSDRWNNDNQENATFPRLTTGSSAHNYQNSTYWMYDNSYFDLARVQLTYALPKKLMQKSGIGGLEISVIGDNLYRFSKNREYMELNIGSEPQFRSVLLGLRMSF